MLGFLGPNGAGKSTTMRMITGNLAPSAGRVTINGIDLLEDAKLAKRHIGYLPEQPPVYRELTVDEYLHYCARLHRLAKGQRNKAVDNAKQRCGLSDTSKRLIGNLSKGFQQRVGIAQAILHSPDVVILDEPTVGLDPIQIRDIRRLIRELGENHGIILSTHILPEVQAVCSRVQIIHQGQLVFAESMDNLQQRFNRKGINSGNPNTHRNRKTARPGRHRKCRSARRHTGTINIQWCQPGRQRGPPLVSEQNWGLVELALERRGLEQIFVDLTTGEQAADGEGRLMIFTIAMRELKSLFLSPLAWALLAVMQLIMAYLFLSQLDTYMYWQPKLAGYGRRARRYRYHQYTRVTNRWLPDHVDCTRADHARIQRRTAQWNFSSTIVCAFIDDRNCTR